MINDRNFKHKTVNQANFSKMNVVKLQKRVLGDFANAILFLERSSL